MENRVKTYKTFDAKILAKMALMLSLIIVSGMITIPIPALGVPIVLQNMFIMLTAGFLGKKYGFWTIAMFLCLVSMGLPLLAGGRGGIVLLFSPSGGFLIGYFFCSFIICSIVEKLGVKSYWRILIAYFIGGTIFINFMGSVTLAYYSHSSWWSGLKMAAFFLPIDTAKAIVAAIIYQRLKRYSFMGENR
ncbi:biotin transporter BioY [Candidatus Enterococcus courvalinii]|uniref:Biotin transporter n=1 Tax=Candidatus Enterococcus courvalinii TaxID=2815329 RepID=A0ABS3HXB7_9ENTE|nr:biotin transporter BioY [Enterococcus sp. MSG2901]MBO0481106.1 biotin transporter BioY [Enterococcus sp. MSG2901]